MSSPASRAAEARERTADDFVGWKLIVLGAVATLVFGAIFIARDSGLEPAQRYTFPLLGHLVVLVLVAGGFRRSGAVLAIVLGAVCLPVAALLALLSLLAPDESYILLLALCAVAQVVLLAGGIIDLRTIAKHGVRPVPETRPWLALLGGVALLVVLIGNPFTRLEELSALRARERQYAADRQAEKDYWARWFHYELNETQQLAQCIERFRMASAADAYPASLDELARWARADSSRRVQNACWSWLHASGDSTTSSIDPHHTVRYAPPRRPIARDETGGYTLTVETSWAPGDEPRPALVHGKWNYFLDTTGLIHRASVPAAATATDPLAPVCEPEAEVNGCQSPHPKRYRWGLGTIPTVRAAIAGPFEGKAGDSVTASFVFAPLIAADSVVALEVRWGDDSTWTKVKAATARRPEAATGRIVLEARHVYAKGGDYQLRAAVVTTGKERFEGRHWARIRDRN